MSSEARQGRLGAGVAATVRLLPKVDRGGTFWLAGLMVLSAGLPVAFVVASGRLVGQVPDVVGAGLGSPPGRSLLLTLLAVTVIYLAQELVDQLKVAHAENLGRRLNSALRERMVAASLGPAGLSHFHDPANLDAISLARDPGPGRFQPGAAVVGLAQGIPGRLSALGAAVVVGTYAGWLMALVVVVWSVSMAVLLRWLFASLRTLVGGQADLRRALYFRDLATTAPAAKEVRLFGLAGWVAERYLRDWDQALAPSHSQRRRTGGTAVLAAVAIGATMGFALWTIGSAGADGRLTVERAAVLLQAAVHSLTVYLRGSDMSAVYGAASVPAVLGFSRSSATAAEAPPGGYAAVSLVGRPSQAIRLEGVSFTYPGAERPVLAGLDLEIPAGQRLAVVGTNGAGKSTLVMLLAGLYRPDAGTVTVDGLDLAGLDPAAWRGQLSVLFQDYLRYELTAAENIGFGAVDGGAPAGREALEQAARRAGAASIIDGLEHGWDSVLTRAHQGGVDLSGGQWQRVALARALVAVDAGARLLILDEPTANLDVRAEARVYSDLLDALGSQPVTTVLVSHRFSTVRRADRIIVVEDGRIAEDGTHAALLALGGRYATMFNLQAARFDA